MKLLSCGNCGCSEFNVYEEDVETSGIESPPIIIKCKECKSTTVITAEAQLIRDWGERSNGVLCVLSMERK